MLTDNLTDKLIEASKATSHSSTAEALRPYCALVLGGPRDIYNPAFRVHYWRLSPSSPGVIAGHISKHGREESPQIPDVYFLDHHQFLHLVRTFAIPLAAHVGMYDQRNDFQEKLIDDFRTRARKGLEWMIQCINDVLVCDDSGKIQWRHNDPTPNMLLKLRNKARIAYGNDDISQAGAKTLLDYLEVFGRRTGRLILRYQSQADSDLSSQQTSHYSRSA